MQILAIGPNVVLRRNSGGNAEAWTLDPDEAMQLVNSGSQRELQNAIAQAQGNRSGERRDRIASLEAELAKLKATDKKYS